MSNFQEKFNDWQEKMSKKSEKEKHNAAITIAFSITALVFFFVASNWYFEISGNSYDSSLFTDIENVWDSGKTNFTNSLQDFSNQKNEVIQMFSQIKNATTTIATPTSPN